MTTMSYRAMSSLTVPMTNDTQDTPPNVSRDPERRPTKISPQPKTHLSPGLFSSTQRRADSVGSVESMVHVLE